MVDQESPLPQSLVANSDINTAAALRAQYAIETPKLPRRRHKKLTREEVEEPLVDDTAALTLHSKKTKRLQKQHEKKLEKAANKPAKTSLLDLPAEIITEILGHLRAADVFHVQRTCRTMTDYVTADEKIIAKDIISRRYWILHRCFPLPVAFKEVSEDFHPGLLSERRLELLNIHRKPYQHIEMVNPHEVCTCMTCVFGWNNLCLLVDLHYWQKNLATREPIPMISRGTNPLWNQNLLRENADVVRHAMEHPLWYAAILEKHLESITGTILRFSKWKKKGQTAAQPRLYRMTDWDVASENDTFLDRKGPPSYDFPFHRDNYYSLEAYLPNRKFGDDGKWHYYPLHPAQHEKDLHFVKSSYYANMSSQQRKERAMASLKDHNIRWTQYLERVEQV